MRNLILFVSLLFVFSNTYARPQQQHHPYYGEWAQVFNVVHPEKLKALLHTILSHAHISVDGESDKIIRATSCPVQVQNCYRHVLARFESDPVGDSVRDFYRNARHVLYQAVTPMKVAPGLFHFDPIYFTQPIVIQGADDHRFSEVVRRHAINAEHVWPQSKFGGHKNSFQNRFKKTDLHSIYPANTKMNSYRGSFPLGEVVNNSSDPNFGNVVGRPTKGQERGQYFMPIPSSRGRVARSMMYFSTRYNMPINPIQEYYIRKWHREYPVTKTELVRNNRVFKYQKVRNPFIDYPSIESHIADF